MTIEEKMAEIEKQAEIVKLIKEFYELLKVFNSKRFTKFTRLVFDSQEDSLGKVLTESVSIPPLYSARLAHALKCEVHKIRLELMESIDG